MPTPTKTPRVAAATPRGARLRGRPGRPRPAVRQPRRVGLLRRQAHKTVTEATVDWVHPRGLRPRRRGEAGREGRREAPSRRQEAEAKAAAPRAEREGGPGRGEGQRQAAKGGQGPRQAEGLTPGRPRPRRHATKPAPPAPASSCRGGEASASASAQRSPSPLRTTAIAFSSRSLGDRQVLREVGPVDGADRVEDLRVADDAEQVLDRVVELGLASTRLSSPWSGPARWR